MPRRPVPESLTSHHRSTFVHALITTTLALISPASLLAQTASWSTCAASGACWSGTVGIGTTNPMSDLEVHNPTPAYPASTGTFVPDPAVTLRLRAAGVNSTLDMGASGVSPYGSWIQARNYYYLGATEPLLLQPIGGNVGIGTTSPGVALDVVGNIRASNGFLFSDGSSLSSAAGLTNISHLTVTSSGSLGVGTSNPVGVPQVNGGDIIKSTTFAGNQAGNQGRRTQIPLLANLKQHARQL